MAAGSTYTPIATTTLGTATSTVTFSSISGSYTDLVLIFDGNTSAIANTFMRFNSDSSSPGKYSMTWMAGTGSSALSGRESSETRLLIDVYSYPNPSNITNKVMNFPNYSNTTTYKTVLWRSNNSAAGVEALVGLWRSTDAITRIDILTLSATTFSVGSTFTLYGIAAA